MRTKSYTTLLLLAIFCLLGISAFAQPKKVLFIGNSYTAVNSLPWLVYSVALANGDTITTDVNSPGGFTFQGHTTDSVTLAKINSQQWDYVILQEQSQRPSFPPAQVANQVYPYATQLVNLIRANNPCTEIVFYMTWGRKNGDASNCAGWPPVCTYEGMQARLRESYMEMGLQNDATVAPVGAAWSYAISQGFAFDLFSPDESHPSMFGSYLTANVIYSTMFNKSTIGNPFHTTITTQEAALLQDVAHAVAIDSISTWYQYGSLINASFATNVTGSQATFSNSTTNATSYLWNFGDGTIGTGVNPVHTYTSNGVYTVTLTASNSCKSVTVSQQVVIGPTAIDESATCELTVTSQRLLKTNCENGFFSKVEVNGVDGRKVYEAIFRNNMQLPDLTKGIYFIRLSGRGKDLIRKVVIQ